MKSAIAAAMLAAAVIVPAASVSAQEQPSQPTKPPFPATLSYRKAATGPGYVLVVNTTIKQDMPALLVIESAGLGTKTEHIVNLS